MTEDPRRAWLANVMALWLQLCNCSEGEIWQPTVHRLEKEKRKQ